MKAQTLARLDILAAAQETQLLAVLRRHDATLKLTAQQRGVLASYRDRLALSWQAGAVVPAAQARRAGLFLTASHGAEAQIDRAAGLATEQFETALASLVRVQSHRRALAKAQRKVARQAENTAELKQERDLPWRGNTPRLPASP